MKIHIQLFILAAIMLSAFSGISQPPRYIEVDYLFDQSVPNSGTTLEEIQSLPMLDSICFYDRRYHTVNEDIYFKFDYNSNQELTDVLVTFKYFNPRDETNNNFTFTYDDGKLKTIWCHGDSYYVDYQREFFYDENNRKIKEEVRQFNYKEPDYAKDSLLQELIEYSYDQDGNLSHKKEIINTFDFHVWNPEKIIDTYYKYDEGKLVAEIQHDTLYAYRSTTIEGIGSTEKKYFVDPNSGLKYITTIDKEYVSQTYDSIVRSDIQVDNREFFSYAHYFKYSKIGYKNGDSIDISGANKYFAPEVYSSNNLIDSMILERDPSFGWTLSKYFPEYDFQNRLISLIENHYNGDTIISRNTSSYEYSDAGLTYYLHNFFDDPKEERTITYTDDGFPLLDKTRNFIDNAWDQGTKKKYFYRVAPEAKEINLRGNQELSITFNYKLDTTYNIADQLSMDFVSTKASTEDLKFTDVYIDRENNKRLVITFNRPLSVGETFEIYSTSDLYFKDGRTGKLAITTKGTEQTSIADAEESVNATVKKLDKTVLISSKAKIKTVVVYDPMGKVLIRKNCDSSPETSIDLSGFANGAYIFSVTLGNDKSQQFSYILE